MLWRLGYLRMRVERHCGHPRREAGGTWGGGSRRWLRWGLIAPTPGKAGLV